MRVSKYSCACVYVCVCGYVLCVCVCVCVFVCDVMNRYSSDAEREAASRRKVEEVCVCVRACVWLSL